MRLPMVGLSPCTRPGGRATLRAISGRTHQVASFVALSMVLLAGCGDSSDYASRELHVCADPNNLPFSNDRREGFENRIAELVAQEMGAKLEYTWWAQRRGFLRSTLRTGECDLVIGMPTSMELALTSRPYYRSTYVFVYRKDANFDIRTFNDPVLRELRIGVHLIGDDYANTPPAHALSSRGMIENLVGFRIYGDYSEENPPARLIEAVATAEIDVAVAWGPLAGYFARRSSSELVLVPVQPQIDLPFLPMVYDISFGVRQEDPALLAEVESIFDRNSQEIARILDDYGIPRLDISGRKTLNEGGAEG